MTLPTPVALIAANLSGLKYIMHPPELHNSEAARRATPEICELATLLFEAMCRADHKPGSLRDDFWEIAGLARTTPRRLKHRWDAIVEILQFHKGDDGRWWSDLAIPICEDAWTRRLASRAATRARFRPHERAAPVPPQPAQRTASGSHSDLIRTPFESHSASKTQGFCGSVAQEAYAEAEAKKETHTPLTESVAEATSLRSGGVCLDSGEGSRRPAAESPTDHPPGMPPAAPPPSPAAPPSHRALFDELAGDWPNKNGIAAAWREFQRQKCWEDPNLLDQAYCYLIAQEKRFGDRYDRSKTPQLYAWLCDGGHLEDYSLVVCPWKAIGKNQPVEEIYWYGPPPSPSPPPPTPEQVAEVHRMLRGAEGGLESWKWRQETPEEAAEFARQKAACLAKFDEMEIR